MVHQPDPEKKPKHAGRPHCHPQDAYPRHSGKAASPVPTRCCIRKTTGIFPTSVPMWPWEPVLWKTSSTALQSAAWTFRRNEESPSGDLSVMLNSVVAAQGSHRFIYRSWVVEDQRQPLAHTILRGAVNKHGEALPNYHYEDLRLLWEKYQEKNLLNPAVIVDTNHSNSNKKYEQAGPHKRRKCFTAARWIRICISW